MNTDGLHSSPDTGAPRLIVQPQPLPVEFEPRARQVDALLSRAVRVDRDHMPHDLSQRIFELSVGSLPAIAGERERAALTGTLRLVGTPARRSRLTLAAATGAGRSGGWGRMALAASVLLVAGIALTISQPRTAAAKIDVPYLGLLATDTEVDSAASELWYLLDSTQVRSFEDVSSDVRMLVQELEM